MAPSVGKLICNNRDASHQRDEDTASMMEMISRKRNGTIVPVETNRPEAAHALRVQEQEEFLKIAETIRELAAKLEVHRELFNSSESNQEVNASLNRTLEQIQKSISYATDSTTRSTHGLSKSLLASTTPFTARQDDEWLIDIVTPKAGNVTLTDEKTPLHSNRTRHHQIVGHGKAVSKNANGAYRHPYPSSSNKRVPAKNMPPQNQKDSNAFMIDDKTPLHSNRSRQQQFNGYSVYLPSQNSTQNALSAQSSVNEALANLRIELSKSKSMEHLNTKLTPKNRPFSTRNQRSKSQGRSMASRSFEEVEQKVGHSNVVLEAAGKSMEKLRALSTGRAVQQGRQIVNRILRRENQEDEIEKTLTATSSDSTHDPIPLSRQSKNSTVSDAKLDLVVNRHYKSSRNDPHSESALNRRGNKEGSISRKWDKDQSLGTNRTSTGTAIHENKRPITIDVSMSSASTTSAYLPSNTANGPIKYRTILNQPEKGFELFMPDGITPVTNSKTVQSIQRDGRENHNRISSIDRVAISQRLQHHQRSIKERIRKDLSISTDPLTTANRTSAAKIDVSTSVTQNNHGIKKGAHSAGSSIHAGSTTTNRKQSKSKRAIIRE
jgi:hypothetical protein